MINLHITRQTYDFDCGVKALQTVMAYYGEYVREDALIAELGADGDGTRVERVIAAAEARGFRVEAREQITLRALRRWIDAGHPVIVLLQAWADRYMTRRDWREDYEDGHYAIVIGYEKGILIFEDPSSFRRTWLKVREFLLRWHDVDSHDGKTYERFGMVLLGREPARPTMIHMD